MACGGGLRLYGVHALLRDVAVRVPRSPPGEDRPDAGVRKARRNLVTQWTASGGGERTGTCSGRTLLLESPVGQGIASFVPVPVRFPGSTMLWMRNDVALAPENRTNW